MKSLFKSGICLAFCCLTTSAGAQDRWQPSNTAVRPVGLSQPVRLEPGQDAPVGAFRPITVRGQAGDEKPIVIGPVLGAKEPALKVEPPLKVEPKALPKDNGPFPPPPQPLGVTPMPSTVWGGMGIMHDGDCCLGDCGMSGYGRGGHGALFGSDGCCPDRFRCWLTGEYLMWWQRSQTIPPLVTASPNGTPISVAGVLGAPTTTILYDQAPNALRSGGRFSVGTWLPNHCNLALEANFFFLLRQEDTSKFGPEGGRQITLPFVDVSGVPFPSAETVAINNSTDKATGTASVQTYSQIWGGDINLRKKWLCGQNYWFDLLAGYRHINISEGIEIDEAFQASVVNNQATTFAYQGHSGFHTRNQFNGGQIGIEGEYRFWDRVFLGMSGKIAMGCVSQSINIEGNQSQSGTVPSGNFPGHLYAAPTNIGRYTANRFAVVPEVGIKLGYEINEQLRVFVGYNFLYLSNAVRPGEQIDNRVNPARVFPGTSNTGPVFPTVLFRTSEYWAQGLTFGMQYRW